LISLITRPKTRNFFLFFFILFFVLRNKHNYLTITIVSFFIFIFKKQTELVVLRYV
jgi:hypothetical protein